MHINSYKTILALFKFGGQMKNCQITKLKSPLNRRIYTYKEVEKERDIVIKKASK